MGLKRAYFSSTSTMFIGSVVDIIEPRLVRNRVKKHFLQNFKVVPETPTAVF